MTQPLWYLRHEGRVVGPFPVPQIKEFLQAGEISPDWEASLDETDWLTLRESEQFDTDMPAWIHESDPDRLTWRQQREKARQRWLDDAGQIEQAEIHNKRSDDLTRRAIDVDHEHTQTLIEAQRRQGPPVWAGLLGIVVLAALGYAVWYGSQGEKTMQAGITLKVNCAAILADGVNWSGCDKHNLSAAGASARNAHLDHARLDSANLANANLSYAILTGSNLRNADLQGAKLTGADLTGADLTGANLADTLLDFAVLRGAILEGARLQGARLGKAEWLDGHVCDESSVGDCR